VRVNGALAGTLSDIFPLVSFQRNPGGDAAEPSREGEPLFHAWHLTHIPYRALALLIELVQTSPMTQHDQSVWSVQEAKAKLSEVLRRARQRGPQTIGTADPCVVVSAGTWRRITGEHPSLARWLLDHPPPAQLDLPSRKDAPRAAPFEDEG
jgi:prevent-host-death family protein